MNRLLLGIAVATLTAGCARRPTASTWTTLRADEMLLVKKNLGTALRLRGTYLSDTFRRVVAEERGRLLGEAVTDDDAYLRRTLDDGSAYHEVVFTAETALIDAELKFGETITAGPCASWPMTSNSHWSHCTRSATQCPPRRPIRPPEQVERDVDRPGSRRRPPRRTGSPSTQARGTDTVRSAGSALS